MTPPELLATLRRLRVRIWVDGDRLRVDAPKGAITPQIQAEITRHKSAILDVLDRVSRGSSTDDIPLRPAPRHGNVPLSFFQERVWILDLLTPGNSAYNIVALLRDTGPMDQVALRASLTEMMRRHEILRTTFADVGGSPAQVVHPARSVLPRVNELLELSVDGWGEELRRIMSEEAAQPFVLSDGPLVRTRFVPLTTT